MAGFTDYSFRQLCKEFGADVMLTEFVHAEKFLHQQSSNDAWRTVDFSPSQRPMGVQIFGGDPQRMAEAAKRILDRLQPDFIDINYGCPAPRVVNNACGSSLLRQPRQLQAIAAAVVAAVSKDIPVTAKIRLGWDDHSINALDNARRLADAGIEALAIHGRTKEQGYRGDANWQAIEEVAAMLSIPVIGNGSINASYDIPRILANGHVRGVMVGRSALGNPWIFRELKAAANGLPIPAPPSPEERWDVLLRYADSLAQHRDLSPWDSINWSRSRLKAFARDFPGSKTLRGALEKVSSMEELHTLAETSGYPQAVHTR